MKQWVISILRDIAYVFKIVLCHLFSIHKILEKDIAPDTFNSRSPKTPILLIHGSGGSQKEWLDSWKHIKNNLDFPCYAFTIGKAFNKNTASDEKNKASKHMTIADYARHVKSQIIYLNSLHDSKVILIGHSMGGLIAAQLATEIPYLIDDVITIGSPLQGAPLLANPIFKFLLNTARHNQMTPSSVYLETLHENTRQSIRSNPSIRYLTIGSVNDIHVPDSHTKFPIDIRIAHRMDHITVDSYGHFSIVSSHDIWRTIAFWIKLKIRNPIVQTAE